MTRASSTSRFKCAHSPQGTAVRITMRTVYLVAATGLVALAVSYVVMRPPADEPAKPLTMADIQQRRESQHESQPEPKSEVPHPSPAAPTVTRTDEPIGYIADANLQFDRPMVGLTFQMSDSVVESCGREGQPFYCEELDKFLARMKVEPRDPAWAPKVEAFIVKSLEVEERGALRIRSLECRSARCALEVASEAQRGIQQDWKTSGLDLMEWMPVAWGTEWDKETGIVTRVYVHTWRRKSLGYEAD